MADALAATFRKPFAEQVAAFRLRLGDLVPTSRWDDLRGSAHDRAFMVAGAVKADLLADLAGAVDKAISQGTSLEEFRRDFRSIVETRGWHGWTGEGTKAGEAWRTRVIYRTNAATSYAAGRMAQLREGGFDQWVYRHGGSREPRPEHLAWDGLILPPDHPFWETHAPPNGWGCSCRIAGSFSEFGAERVGGDPEKTLPPGWDATDPRTGTPPGVGKGWDHAPGASVSDTVQSLAGKLDQLPPQPSIALIQDWLQASAFETWFADPVGSFPLVRLSDADAELIGASSRIAALSAETAGKQSRNHPEISLMEYAMAQRVVSDPSRKLQDGPRSLIYLLETPGETGHVMVVKATQTGAGLFVTSFRRMSRQRARRDREVARLISRTRGE